tara:strand:+ start:2309 stop:2488 length:180 start_codon:yes stop_codon:yes gene_type:complete
LKFFTEKYRQPNKINKFFTEKRKNGKTIRKREIQEYGHKEISGLEVQKVFQEVWQVPGP